MDTGYIAYDFVGSPKELVSEILIAQLSHVGFESFIEHKTGLTAYIQKEEWNPKILDHIFVLNSNEFEITYQQSEIAQTNWNEKWEKNFNPIQVNDLVAVRAPFHRKTSLKYEIVIEPKMSFGTGHHETTQMMIQQMLQLDIQNKKVLDLGCGTGILAIFAEMRGANSVDAIDVNSWCYKNSLENIKRNGCQYVTVYKGDASLLKEKKYDVIIANLNRNALLSDIELYTSSLYKKGFLLLSGFYREDVTAIDQEAKKYGLRLDQALEKNKWVSLKYLTE